MNSSKTQGAKAGPAWGAGSDGHVADGDEYGGQLEQGRVSNFTPCERVDMGGEVCQLGSVVL